MKFKSLYLLIPFIFVTATCLGLYWVNCRQPESKNLLLSKLPVESSNDINEQFLNFLESKKKLPPTSREVSLIAVGDISYSRGVERIIKKNDDVNYPFLKISDYLDSSDFTFGNLETPITPGREIQTYEMVFRSNPGTEQALNQAGFSIVSLANNHTPNFGFIGLENTFNFLDQAGIKYAGAGLNQKQAYEPVLFEFRGIKFSLLAYNDNDVVPPAYEAGEDSPGTAFMSIPDMTVAVGQSKKISDYVIVSMHSGTEYIEQPNDSQINFARAAIDAGADLVIGHHPHVVQTMEKYKGKYIFYSLGNFVFDQPWSRETERGLAIKVYFCKNNINKISFLPIVMYDFAQPEIATNQDTPKILGRLDFPLKYQTSYSFDSQAQDFILGSRAVVYPQGAPYCTSGNLSKQIQADIDSDFNIENYSLNKGCLTITENTNQIWASPPEWWIDDFVIADSNNDGILDINLSLWKQGDFGPSRPFWVDENDPRIRNHFFILNLVDGNIKTVWGSSNLSQPNCEFKIDDVDNDGKNDLVVLEGDYGHSVGGQAEYIAVWHWNQWGFMHKWRSSKACFCNLEIESIDNKKYILADNCE